MFFRNHDRKFATIVNYTYPFMFSYPKDIGKVAQRKDITLEINN